MVESQQKTQPTPAVSLGVLLTYAKPWRNALLMLAAVMGVETLVLLAIPWAAGHFAGAALQPNASLSLPAAASLAALLMFQAGLRYGASYLGASASEDILAGLRMRLFDHLQALPVAYFDARRHGDTLAHLTNDAEQVGQFLSGTLVSIVPMLFTFAGAFALMLVIDPVLAAAVVCLLPLAVAAFKIAGRRLRPLSAQYQDAYGRMLALAEENLALLPAVKLFTLERRQSMHFATRAAELTSLGRRQHRVYAALEPAMTLLAGLGLIALIWLGHQRVSAGADGTGALVSFLLYAALLARPLSALGALYGRTQLARGAATRLHAVFAEAPEAVAGTGKVLDRIKGCISFSAVTFAYPDRPAALDQLSLDIEGGETIAITGPNGSGKSTLVQLLLRLYAPQSGRIQLDGYDVAGIEMQSLRRAIGVVPQRVLLANATVRENIAFGWPSAHEDQIIAAAKAGEAHDFIMALPHGYDTVIGDQGIRLSGGQRQRLALARALLKDPAVLILDEATAMFDPQAEAQFIARCRTLLSGRTVIIISHRPASLALADRIVRLEAGKVAAIETPRREARA